MKFHEWIRSLLTSYCNTITKAHAALLFTGLLLTLFHYPLSASWDNKPVLIRISDAVKPGGLININGEGLAGGLITVAMYKDTDGSSPSLPPAGSLLPEIIQDDRNGHFLVVKFPPDAPAGVYNVWVSNSKGWSNLMKLNAPRVLYQSEYEVWPGQSIQVVGRNFDSREFGAQTDVLVRLSDGSSHFLQNVTDSNPYRVTFTVGDHPQVTYTVQLSNDYRPQEFISFWCSSTSASCMFILDTKIDSNNKKLITLL